jgi:hypothetical protein
MENVAYQTNLFESKTVDTGIKVYKSNNYDNFKIIEGNRPPNPKHVNRLYQSIVEHGLLCNPIIVNKKYEIIDGQHRYLACKKAGISVYYIMLDDYGLTDVHTLNLNQKNWTKKDFMDGYADMGEESYIKLRLFSQKNSDFAFTDCISLCSNNSTASGSFMNQKNRQNDSVVKVSQSFEEGTWKGKDFELAQTWADKIREVKTYFDGYNKSVFVGTMVIMLQNKSFDFNEFMAKLKIQPKALYDCANREQCKLMIENVYNYRRREKVGLRY